MVRDFLSAKDRKTLERGYYEDLTNVERFSPELAAIYGKQPEDWAESDAIVTDYTRFPFVFWAPSAHSRFRGAEITTNQWGMRDREYTREKPPGVYRIALLGSSHSAGSGVGDAETYENLVEDRLNRERDPGAPKYEVLNFSMGGYGAISKLATLEQKALGFSPDLVLFEITSEYERIVQNLNTAEEHGVVIPYDFVNRALAEAGVTSGTPRVEVFNRMMPRAPDLLRAAFARADSSCRAAGARMVVVVLPETTDPGEAALRSWRGAGAIAGELGIPFLDLTAAYRDAGPLEDLWVAPWDRHPNPRGHALLADALYPKLVGVLTPSP